MVYAQMKTLALTVNLQSVISKELVIGLQNSANNH